MNREDVIRWCKDNNCNFIDPVFPPPEDWMWVKPDNTDNLYLSVIFTSQDYKDIHKDLK